MEQRVSRLEGAYEQVDARLHDIGQGVESLRAETNARFAEVNGTIGSLRAEMNARFAEVNSTIESLRAETNSRFNTLMVIMIGSWITTILAIIGLYFTRFVE